MPDNLVDTTGEELVGNGTQFLWRNHQGPVDMDTRFCADEWSVVQHSPGGNHFQSAFASSTENHVLCLWYIGITGGSHIVHGQAIGLSAVQEPVLMCPR